MADSIERKIDFLRRYFEELQKKVSEARKKGKDTFMADLRMMCIPEKIRYAEISGDKKDIDRVKKMLVKLQNEIPK